MQYVTVNRNCDLCGSNNNTELWNKEQREKENILASKVIKNEGNHINSVNVVCNNCGMVFVNPVTTKDTLQEFYKKEYRKIYTRDNGQASTRHANTALNILMATKTFNQPFLDIGANEGQLIDLVKSVGKSNSMIINATGIEPGNDSHKNIVDTTIEEYETNTKYRCITMLNTLEHMYSPTETLNKIHEIADDKAFLLISVPDILNTSINISVDAYLSNAHLFNFSEKTLKDILQKCGWKPVYTCYVDEEMGRKLYVLSQKDTPVELNYKPIDVEKLKAFLHYIELINILKYDLRS